MAQRHHDFGPVTRLDADAVGQPGKRAFRLLVASGEGTASLWLEKEELQALGVATEQLLARLSGQEEWRLYGAPSEPYRPVEGFPLSPAVDLKVGQLSLGYEGDSRMFALLVHEAEVDPTDPPTFSCLATAAQMRYLSRRISSVISAGRPKCPVCGDPSEPEGHVCARMN